jgi:hypothetical protein
MIEQDHLYKLLLKAMTQDVRKLPIYVDHPLKRSRHILLTILSLSY